MTVHHRLGAYDIEFTDLARALARLPEDHIVVTDSNVQTRLLGGYESARMIVVPAGESAKTLTVFGGLLSELARRGATRKTHIVAVGGGVVGDLAGYAAASFMRGVPFVQIPTTLLAQVDSSVGGKVGIDLPEGKNLAGAFYPPVHVAICIEALELLPKRDFVNGMAEVLKYGFIMDPPILAAAHRAINDPMARREVVARCIELKAKVVEADEFETNGYRAILNYGHTVGHAIERVTGYGPILHGEAIAIGMVAEAKLGSLLGVTPPDLAGVVADNLAKAGLPIHHEVLDDTDGLIAAMATDKKRTGAGLGFSLLTGLGECKLVPGVPASAVAEALRRK